MHVSRKKLRNCYWSNSTTLRNNHEYVKGCDPDEFQRRFKVNPRLYRTNTGACNNLHPEREHWGMTGLPFDRLLKADFDSMADCQ